MLDREAPSMQVQEDRAIPAQQVMSIVDRVGLPMMALVGRDMAAQVALIIADQEVLLTTDPEALATLAPEALAIRVPEQRAGNVHWHVNSGDPNDTRFPPTTPIYLLGYVMSPAGH